ncbi:MAG: amidohydrolase family protein [Candidatus Tectomicrobia bacterium]|nr:amidohydrolase family protein [Candidatus Tectomicrobia bacterium]
MGEFAIIDADGHAMDLEEVCYRGYLDEPYRRRSSPLYPMESYDRRMGGTLGRPGTDVRERLADMDLSKIQHSVLYPTLGLFIGKIREPEFATALCRAYNDWVADHCAQAGGRLSAVALLPPNGELATAELNRAVTKHGLVGGMLPAHGHAKSFGNSEFYPLYEEAERLNVPLAIHASGGDEPGTEMFDAFICVHTCGHPLPIMRQLTAVIFSGICDRFSTLRLGFLEAGAGWVPYWMDRMDEEYEKRAVEAPNLKVMPSEHVKGGRIYFSCEPEEETMPFAVENLGEQAILFASDYPHWDMTYPDCTAPILERKELSDSAKRAILGENARRFYGKSFVGAN